jgi:membrane-bound inhibitor of C-type lysozyme
MIVKRLAAGFIVALCMTGCVSNDREQEFVGTRVYLGENGERATVTFLNRATTAQVQLPDGNRAMLPLVDSPSGASYSDGQMSFWTSGKEGVVKMGGRAVFRGLWTTLPLNPGPVGGGAPP